MEPVAFAPVTDDADDAAALLDLFSRARGHDLGASAWPESIRSTTLRLQFDAQRQGYALHWPAAETFFLVSGGAPAGWLIVDRGPRAIHVVDIAVVPERRGKGIGGAALRALQDEAARTGRKLVLSVGRGNLPAIRFYSRLGFQPTAASEMDLSLEWRPPAFAAPEPAPAPAEAPPAPAAGATWSPAAFRAATDTWFEVPRDDGPVFLLLKEVDERPPVGGLSRFSVLLHGPGDRPLPQGSQTIRHQALGEMWLLLVPVIGSSAETIVYEICFSYPTPAE